MLRKTKFLKMILQRIGILDENGIVVDIDTQYEQLLGKHKEEIIGYGFFYSFIAKNAEISKNQLLFIKNSSLKMNFTSVNKAGITLNSNISSFKIGQKDYFIVRMKDTSLDQLYQNQIEIAFKELKLIHSINKASVEETSLSELSKLTLDSYSEMSRVEGGRFYLYQKERNSLKLIHERLDNSLISKIEEGIGTATSTIVPSLNSKGGYFVEAIHSNKLIVLRSKKEIISIIEEHTNNTLLKKLAKWAAYLIDIKTFIVVPIKSKGRIFGLISLYSSKELDDDEVGRINRFTNGITAALAKKQVEKEIQDVANVVSHSRDAIIRISTEGLLLTWNKGAEEMFGFKREEIIGKSIREITPIHKYEESKKIISNIYEMIFQSLLWKRKEKIKRGER